MYYLNIVYNYAGENKDGKWLRKSVHATFTDISDFVKYMSDNDSRVLFGKYAGGTFIFTRAAIEFIRYKNDANKNN